MGIVEYLFNLQKIDKGLKDIEQAQLDQTDLKKLIKMKKREKKMEIKIGELEWKLKSIKHNLKKDEIEVMDLSQQIENYNQKLYDGSTQNPKELSHLESKIDNLSNTKYEMEKKIFSSMEENENIQLELSSLKKEYEIIKNKRSKMENSFKQKMIKLKDKEKVLRSKRKKLINVVPDEYYNKYLRLYSQYEGKAVVTIKNKCCSGCQVSLSAILLDTVRKSDKPVYCEFCGRILVFQDE